MEQKGHFIGMRSLPIPWPYFTQNPFLADWLIQTALIKSIKTDITCTLDDTLANLARCHV